MDSLIAAAGRALGAGRPFVTSQRRITPAPRRFADRLDARQCGGVKKKGALRHALLDGYPALVQTP